MREVTTSIEIDKKSILEHSWSLAAEGESAEDIRAVVAGTKPCALILPIDRFELKELIRYAHSRNIYVRHFQPLRNGCYTAIGDEASCELLGDALVRLISICQMPHSQDYLRNIRACQIEIGRILGYDQINLEQWLPRVQTWGLSNKHIMGIYQITHLPSSRIYIGSSDDIRHRWATHRSRLRKNEHHSPYLQNVWNKHGGVEFRWEVLECVLDAGTLLSREQYYLDVLKPQFNVSPTANSRRGCTQKRSYRTTREIMPGEIFGKWTVLNDPLEIVNKAYRIPCQCSCGTHRLISPSRLLKSVTTSCGNCKSHLFAIGTRFGLLEIISEVTVVNRHGRVMVRCHCPAKTEKLVRTECLLRNPGTTSCGCTKSERFGNITRKHGYAGSPIYKTWKSIKRCIISSKCDFDEGWLGFEGFKDWAISAGYQEGMRIERQDRLGGYCPDNYHCVPAE
jgi:hypothetical protein